MLQARRAERAEAANGTQVKKVGQTTVVSGRPNGNGNTAAKQTKAGVGEILQ